MTTIASLMVTVGANIKGLTSGLNEADRKLGQTGQSASSMSLAVVAGATALVGLGVAAVNAAVEWESAFSGVEKTVDASAEELAVLEEQLRDMATDTSNPVAGLENAAVTLAKIAELGGSLGIATGDIDEFTQTIAMLDIATDLTAESAATMTAQFANITGMDVSDYDNFGAALVDLGNKMAATEPQILEFGQRMAGAGDRAGMSEADILGFGAAMASLGLDAEAGGTAFSQTMNTIVEAVGRGGPELDTLAEAAGTSADAFRDNWANDPAQAFVDFLTGLGEMSPADQLATLDELGLSGVRVSDALSRMSNNIPLVTQGLEVSNQAWEDNTALMTEAEKKFGTTESKMNLFKNNLNELGIQVGELLLPVLNDLLTGLTDFVSDINSGDLGTVLDDVLNFAEGIINLNLNALGLDSIDLPDFTTALQGWQTFFDSVGLIIQTARNEINIELNNIAVAFRTLGREIDEGILRLRTAKEDLALAINPNDATAAGNRAGFVSQLQGIETAENLEKQITDSMAAGNLSIDVSQFVTSDPAAIAEKIADPMLIQEAVNQAMAEGDAATQAILMPIAAELSIAPEPIVEQSQTAITNATDKQQFLANLYTVATVFASRVDLGPLKGAIDSAINESGLASLIPQIPGAQTTPVHGAASGARILSNGLVMAHQNEVILNSSQQASLAGKGGGTIGSLVIQTNDAQKLLFDLKVMGIDLEAMAKPS